MTLSTKMLSLHFLMILIRKPFSTFATPDTAPEQENQCKNMRFEFRFLETHHSTIPLFHHSNWGEAPKFHFS
jgi:hypothetical protein